MELDYQVAQISVSFMMAYVKTYDGIEAPDLGVIHELTMRQHSMLKGLKMMYL